MKRTGQHTKAMKESFDKTMNRLDTYGDAIDPYGLYCAGFKAGYNLALKEGEEARK